MSTTRHSFKDTQLFDWEAEPALERSSSFFYPDDTLAEHAARARRRSERRQRGSIVVLLTCVTALGLGFIAMIELAPVLQHWLANA